MRLPEYKGVRDRGAMANETSGRKQSDRVRQQQIKPLLELPKKIVAAIPADTRKKIRGAIKSFSDAWKHENFTVDYEGFVEVRRDAFPYGGLKDRVPFDKAEPWKLAICSFSARSFA